MFKAILSEDFQKSCRKIKAGHLKVVRRGHRMTHRFLKRFFVSSEVKITGDNFPKGPLGFK